MKNTYKYILLYASFLILLSLMIVGVNQLKDKNISLEDGMLVKKAQVHFKDQVNTRAWSAQYGGVYVRKAGGLNPNPYLQDNTLQAANGEILIKINPAWMTRQLSELSNSKDFHFRITSVNPLNPVNQADDFETRALQYVKEKNVEEYYEIVENQDFRYLGALITTESCLACHAHQGYKLGDIRGGISIRLDTSEYEEVIEYIEKRAFHVELVLAILLLSITMLVHKQLKSNENLQENVNRQTKELLTTKKLLQEILDTDRSFLMVSNGAKLIFANKTMLDFFNVQTIEEFFDIHQDISNFFIEEKEKDFLSATMDGENWISYLNREQDLKNIQVLMKNKDGEVRCFKPHSKDVEIDVQHLSIVIFNDVTDELDKINILEEKASTDALTKLFNKGKFNEVVFKEMELAKSTFSALSIIFLDIDHFKIVNDTYGHDAGDYILKEIASILKDSVRKGDFVARWGGEEFIITLQAMTADQASIIAEKIRHNIEEYTFTDGGKQTVSLGVTQYVVGESKENLLKRVDEALYAAKQSGRNKVVVK